ncbi:MAG: hypothetical protein PHQ61_01405 [Candidatus Omnitrophica bacterium]|nr:hypothetical protein [Candidatus Omnitrophota bacterium]
MDFLDHLAKDWTTRSLGGFFFSKYLDDVDVFLLGEFFEFFDLRGNGGNLLVFILG